MVVHPAYNGTTLVRGPKKRLGWVEIMETLIVYGSCRLTYGHGFVFAMPFSHQLENNGAVVQQLHEAPQTHGRLGCMNPSFWLQSEGIPGGAMMMKYYVHMKPMV